MQPPGHERERVSGFLIQAMCVVDQAQQRLAGGLPGEQPQRGQPGEKAVRRAAFRHAERHPQRGALRRGGSPSSPGSNGRSNWCAAAKLSSISLSTQSIRMTCMAGAATAWA